MKLKFLPEDFRVEEVTGVTPGSAGLPFYSLQKTNLTTLDALNFIRRRFQLEHRDFSFGGLKDRSAQTLQFLTIHRGPRHDYQSGSIRLKFLGHLEKGYTSKDIVANAFVIILRDLDDAGAQQLGIAIDELRDAPFPNYFDDQRFGSLVEGQFPARLFVLGKYEEGLKLALTAKYENEHGRSSSEKSLLRKKWGRWAELSQQLMPGHGRNIALMLAARPDAFREAVPILWPESQGLMLAAFQSHIWNQMLSELVRSHCDDVVSLRLKPGPVLAPRKMTDQQVDQLSDLAIPLPSARLKPQPGAFWMPLIDAALSQEAFRLEEMKLRGLREPFFSKGTRAGFVTPHALSATFEADERHPGRQKATVRFQLPRGSYGTLIVKRLLANGPHDR